MKNLIWVLCCLVFVTSCAKNQEPRQASFPVPYCNGAELNQEAFPFVYCNPAEWHIGETPFFRTGERVLIINNSRYHVDVSYRTWGEAVIQRLAPWEEGIISGLNAAEYLVARVLNENNEVIGMTFLRIRSSSQGGPQIWPIRFR